MSPSADLPPLTPGELDAYLRRIGLPDPGKSPGVSTLRALHRGHLLSIPYENLEVQFARPVPLDPQAMFDKIVVGGRGGWCYEMNGLFARALRAVGFDVELVSGAVGRDRRGPMAHDNHLVLLVRLENTWIVDVGFGDGFLEPLPLAIGAYTQDFLTYRVSCSGEWWSVHNHPMGGADRYDFTLTPRSLAHFAPRCHDLQTSAESPFVQTAICQRFVPGGIVSMRGAVLRDVSARGMVERVIASADEYAAVLRDVFGLNLPEVRILFPRIWARHLEWSASQAEHRPPHPPRSASSIK